MLLVQLESVSVHREDLRICGMMLLISILILTVSYQLTYVGEFLPTQMLTIL